MATTTNFGWETPDDTDLVKDGAAAMRTLGNSIDTSFVDLKGGTTNQVLAKNSNTDLDFKWVADATGISATIFDAKGDIIAATAADTASRLAVGTNGYSLTAASGETTGLKWDNIGYTEISSQTLSGSQIDFNTISSSYKKLVLVITDFYLSSTTTLRMRFNANSTSSTYYQVGESNATAVNDDSNMFWLNYATGLATTSKKNMCVFQIENYSNSASYKVCNWVTFYDSAAAGIITESMTGGFKDTTAITAINLLPTAGTMSGGTATLWGVK